MKKANYCHCLDKKAEAEVEPSIAKGEIPTFKLAVQWLSHKYHKELDSEFKGKRVTFCALCHKLPEKACKIILDGCARKSNYLALDKSLEILNDWVTRYPSEELETARSNGSHVHLGTCAIGVSSNHEIVEVVRQFEEGNLKLYKDLKDCYKTYA